MVFFSCRERHSNSLICDSGLNAFLHSLFLFMPCLLLFTLAMVINVSSGCSQNGEQKQSLAYNYTTLHIHSATLCRALEQPKERCKGSGKRGDTATKCSSAKHGNRAMEIYQIEEHRTAMQREAHSPVMMCLAFAYYICSSATQR